MYVKTATWKTGVDMEGLSAYSSESILKTTLPRILSARNALCSFKYQPCRMGKRII